MRNERSPRLFWAQYTSIQSKPLASQDRKSKTKKGPKLWLLEECPLRIHNRDVIVAPKAKEIGEEKAQKGSTKQDVVFHRGRKQ